MQSAVIKLICHRIMYHSMIDEEMFFQWVRKIKSITKIVGEGYDLYLFFESANIPYLDLLEITGLFYRYKIVDMRQLQIFINESNREKYSRKQSFWHYRVFGTKKNPKIV